VAQVGSPGCGNISVRNGPRQGREAVEDGLGEGPRVDVVLHQQQLQNTDFRVKPRLGLVKQEVRRKSDKPGVNIVFG
jgi:hypothetical protein